MSRASIQYEEKVVNDRLCWRTLLTHEWILFSATELTSMLINCRHHKETSDRTVEVLKKELEEVLK